MIPVVNLPVTFDRIADFHFIRLLGSGSFAHTYLAERDGEHFAVKVFNDLPAKPSAQARFAREVAALRIQHPNLAEYVAERGRIARWTPGRIHRDAVPAGPLAASRCLTIMTDAWPGLKRSPLPAVLRRASIVCIATVLFIVTSSPPMSIVTESGGVLILDFGLARLQDLATITSRGAFVGTPAYCAPEQIRGEPDIHSDLYALGAIVFEALTGQVPFRAEHQLELMRQITEEDPEAPTALRPEVPGWLDGWS